MDMGKYVAVGVLAVIVLAAATYDKPQKTSATQQASTSEEEAKPEGPFYEASFGAAPASEPATVVSEPEPAPATTEAPAPSPEQPKASPGANPELVKASDEFKEYTVKAGQTLSDIAEELLGSRKAWKQLYEANKDRMPSPNEVREGMKLVYSELKRAAAPARSVAASAPRAGAIQATAKPASGGVCPTDYTVQKGDGLYRISKKVFGTSSRWKEIASLNGISLDNPVVRAGQVLKLPAK